MLNRKVLVLITLVVSIGCLAGQVHAATVDFQRDVAPLLEQRCLSCHNQRDRRGGLSLESAAMLRAGGESGEVVALGDADASYLYELLTPEDGAAEMPKGEPPLSDAERAVFRDWINQGAVWPSDIVLQPPRLWSLAPLRRPTPPPVSDGTADFPIRNPIDAFVAAGHARSHVRPAPPAERRVLIRRLYLDLLGLPPEVDAVEAFVHDQRPDAYERLVDQLLASPHFGERWGRHWLDLARYGDSDGYLGDSIRAHAWVYRQWVIDAINRDLPFDQFSIEQLAGDLLDEPTLDQKIATGFHRNTLRNTEAGVDLELYRTKEIVDRVNTTGMVWLGLTLGCAECHEHKNDPISQAEFYQLYAFFNNADEVGVSAVRSWETFEYEQALRAWRPAWSELVARVVDMHKPDLTEEQRADAAKILDSATKAADLDKLKEYIQEGDAWQELRKRLDKQVAAKPAKPATKAQAFSERTKDRRETFVHIRGVYNRPGDKVTPGAPAVLPELRPRSASPDRLDLARWLFREDNPLTARVAANRVWRHLFGAGIVSSPNDFGTKGDAPTHPELLDWLAVEYRDRGWSRKALDSIDRHIVHLPIVLPPSAVPDQQSLSNQSLWRQNSFRVSAEVVRDLHLAASGLLDRTIGRRGIRPPLPSFVTEVGRSVEWPVSPGGERYRRGMYILFKRTVPYPMLMTFDGPDATVSCGRRERSNTPLQALTLLNDPVFFECAEALGRRLYERRGDDTTAALQDLFATCLSRPPGEMELQYLQTALADLAGLASDAAAAGTGDPSGSETEPELAALIAMSRIVMNLDEFITRD